VTGTHIHGLLRYKMLKLRTLARCNGWNIKTYYVGLARKLREFCAVNATEGEEGCKIQTSNIV
jgi:hypothetical protein